ncbi:ABC transporter ATP-binding protein [Fulvitalea axinellae]|uniref:ABC transporter ATP-binding protein n=1 Tax=Fulvitalea axinellae TaxID=1182444 RepID=A0AAU9CNP5_9BACT|nr:ABC transporter ATP-binding protein [Fulvitalea axinellae]
MDTNEKSGNVIDWQVLKRLFSFMMPYKGKFTTLLALTSLVAILGPARPYLIQVTLDKYVAHGDYNGLVRMTAIIIGLLLVQTAVTYSHTYLSGWLGQTMIRDIRIKLYKHLLNLRLKFFDNTPIGRLVTRNVSDVETLADVFSQGVAAMVTDILQLVIIFCIMLYTDWRLTLVCLSTLPIMIICTYIFKEKVKKSFNNVRNAVAALNSFVQEHLTGMNVVQIFNKEDREYNKFAKINEGHRDANLRSVLYYSIYFPVAEVISASGLALLVWYGAEGVIDERISVGVMVSFIMYISMFFRPIRMIGDRFNTLQMGVVSASRIFKLLDNTDNIPDDGDLAVKDFKGLVEFENVHFAYNEPEYVLKNISFTAQPGQTLALVGATGAGKSSVINLLTRFYDIQKGKISIDGHDVRKYALHDLRRHIGVVLQDVFLFSDTIRGNITLGNPDITDEQVRRAAELVGANRFIERMPDGYDHPVMERGANLSVGQRQLISFVRAMVYDPKIIILDEATSSVDTETEEMIQEAINRLMHGRTAIVIAHRLGTIQNADRIIVLDKGEIKESGGHEELLRLDGYYSRLHRMQYKETL